MARRIRVAVLVAVLLPGCAAMSARPPKPSDTYKTTGAQPCSPSKTGVTMDGTAAVALGLITLALASDAPGPALVTGLGAVVYTGSGIYGSSSADKCRRWIRDGEAEELAAAWEPEPAPRPLPAAAKPAPVTTRAPVPEPEPEPEPEPDADWPDFWRVLP